MTEKQKMIQGQLYNASDDALVADRQRAKKLIFYLNQLDPSEFEMHNSIFSILLPNITNSYCIELPFRCDYGYNIVIGENFYANYNLTILDCAKVTIGNNVFIGPNVAIFTAAHPLCAETRNKGLEFAKPITIGNNVWIGGNVVINPGVTIGHNSVIGSGSVVTKNIEPNVVCAGNPCKVIKCL